MVIHQTALTWKWLIWSAYKKTSLWLCGKPIVVGRKQGDQRASTGEWGMIVFWTRKVSLEEGEMTECWMYVCTNQSLSDKRWCSQSWVIQGGSVNKTIYSLWVLHLQCAFTGLTPCGKGPCIWSSPQITQFKFTPCFLPGFDEPTAKPWYIKNSH